MTCLLLVGESALLAGTAANPIGVYVEGAESPTVGEEITVKHHSSSVRFALDPGTDRYRYKLEGLEDDWANQPGEMKFFVRFLDEAGDQIDQEFFYVSGESEGWTGTVASSFFSERVEELEVPEGADSLVLGISSSGPPETVGHYAVTGITIRTPDHVDGVEYLSQSDPLPGESRAKWNRSGTRPSMAGVARMGGEGGGDWILMTVDDDLLGHADWAMKFESRLKVNPGEALIVGWREVYSVGVGNPISANYDRLPPGNYRFVVEGLDLAGMPLGQVTSVGLRVTRPFWVTPWFWVATLVFVATLIILWGRHLVRKKVNRAQRHAQLISDERLRIARDLHDDLGTRLSHINLLSSSHAHDTGLDGEVRKDFQKITRMLRELIRALSETVWMLNQSNGDLESLITFLCRQVGELCELAEIRCRIDALSVDETTTVSHEFRHSFSLAVKETVNNALRHASASEIQMKISRQGAKLQIVIADNGGGIDPSLAQTGSGLESVAQRMFSIGGSSTIEQPSKGGVQVTLEAPIRAQPAS